MRPDVLMPGMERGRRSSLSVPRARTREENDDHKKKQPLPLCAAFLDPHPDSPLVLSAQLEAPADLPDLVQGPEVQVQPDFREPPRCSSRCQQAARATHSRKDTKVADAVAAGPRRACVKRREPSGRASDDRECWCGRERGEQLSQDRSHSVAARRGVV